MHIIHYDLSKSMLLVEYSAADMGYVSVGDFLIMKYKEV